MRNLAGRTPTLAVLVNRLTQPADEVHMNLSSSMRTRASRVLIIVWLVVVTGATIVQFRYETTPAQVLAAPERWPVLPELKLEPGHAVVLMALHPRCPCSAASIEQLQECVRSMDNRIDLIILESMPAGAKPEWTDSALCRQIKALSRAKLIIDTDGTLASAFGLTTSGQVVAYDSAGELRFNGGLTAARGVEGNNPSSETFRELLAQMLLNDSSVAVSGSETGIHIRPLLPPVFGCKLVAGDKCPLCSQISEASSPPEEPR